MSTCELVSVSQHYRYSTNHVTSSGSDIDETLLTWSLYNNHSLNNRSLIVPQKYQPDFTLICRVYGFFLLQFTVLKVRRGMFLVLSVRRTTSRLQQEYQLVLHVKGTTLLMLIEMLVVKVGESFTFIRLSSELLAELQQCALCLLFCSFLACSSSTVSNQICAQNIVI